MLAGLRQILSSPVAGAVAVASAVALAVVLGLSAATWRVERAGYQQRIAELTQVADRAQTGLRNELSACHAKQAEREALEAEFAARGASGADARQLLSMQPEGIDACARMESADRAVLSNLKK